MGFAILGQSFLSQETVCGYWNLDPHRAGATIQAIHRIAPEFAMLRGHKQLLLWLVLVLHCLILAIYWPVTGSCHETVQYQYGCLEHICAPFRLPDAGCFQYYLSPALLHGHHQHLKHLAMCLRGARLCLPHCCTCLTYCRLQNMAFSLPSILVLVSYYLTQLIPLLSFPRNLPLLAPCLNVGISWL